jgi:hypothetical protein
MPIRNDYGPLRSADTGTVMQLPTDAIAIRHVLQALEHVAMAVPVSIGINDQPTRYPHGESFLQGG